MRHQIIPQIFPGDLVKCLYRTHLWDSLEDDGNLLRQAVINELYFVIVAHKATHDNYPYCFVMTSQSEMAWIAADVIERVDE